MQGIVRRISSDLPGPDIVYHYTSLSAMMNILRTQTIWASHISYLNDVSERHLLLNLADAQLPEFLETHGEVQDVRLDGPLDSSEDGDIENGPFVASFSANGDSLNQWRSYCPIANGVSIGFRVEALEKARFQRRHELASGLLDFTPSARFDAVSYLEPSAGYAAMQALEESLDRAREEHSAMLNEDNVAVRGLEVLFRAHVESAASFYKHSGFAHEAEYRLILPHILFMTEHLHFRNTRSSLVPYVELSVPDLGKHGEYKEVQGWNAVAEIVIGPTPNQELTRKAVVAFCQSQRMFLSVRSSSIPYRDW